MRYGIMINLDYDTNPYDECRDIWQDIRNSMVDSGFRIEGRLFTIEMAPEDACELARGVINLVDGRITTGNDLYHYLKEFYGYDHTNTTNLLLPPSETFELMED